MRRRHQATFHQSDRFVAYDPRKKTCTAADRTLIKRLAGKQGSEAKKRRLRQEKASKTSSLSQNSTNHEESAIASTSGVESQHPPQTTSMAQTWPNTLAATHILDDQDLRYPHPTTDNFWADIGARNSHAMPSYQSAPTLRSWNDTETTPSISVGHSNNLTPAHSDTGGIGAHDYFSLESQFKEPTFINHSRQFNQADQQQQRVPRAFGSFDSGFQDGGTFDYDFTRLIDPGAQSPGGHCLESPGRTSTVLDTLPAIRPNQREASVHTIHANPSPLRQKDVDPFESDTPSDSGRQPMFSSRPGQLDLTTPQTRPSTRNERRDSSQCSRKSPEQSSWPNIDSVLVRWVQYKERQGQLDQGSASACLNALSECEEARSLWSLNLSRINPRLLLSSENANDVYARAKARLQSMSLGQRMDVEGTLIKLGIVEYIAISLTFEITNLQDDVTTRKGLGIWSKAETIVDHRLLGLIPAVRSMSNHLWPDKEEQKSLRGPL